MGEGHLGRVLYQQVEAIVSLAVHLNQAGLDLGAARGEDGTKGVDGRTIEYRAGILRHKDPMGAHLEDAMPSVSNSVCPRS